MAAPAEYDSSMKVALATQATIILGIFDSLINIEIYSHPLGVCTFWPILPGCSS